MANIITSKRRALVVGVNKPKDVPGFTPLTTAVNDATGMAALLKTKGNFIVRTLTDDEATSEAILTNLKWIFPAANEEEDDELPDVSLFYFSGYGAGVTGFTGTPDPAYNGNLVTFDFTFESPETTSLSLSQLAQITSESVAPQKIVWLDSDYSGRFIEEIKEKEIQNNYCFIAASGSDEYAYDVRDEHSNFTHSLLEFLDPDLQEDKRVTSLILADLVQNQFAEAGPAKLQGQRPVILNSPSPILLTQVENRQWLSGYSADAAKGKDLINLERDVQAFATLIAAQSVEPPLSIGIFGEWGSGKTFFMRQLQQAVAKLAIEAQNANKMQCELPFYKRIAQIEFNAWQYVEGNLWASLVEHIFENLHVVGNEGGSAGLQEHLINALRKAEKKAKQDKEYVDKLILEAEAKAKELKQAQDNTGRKYRELQEKILQKDWNMLQLDDTLKEDVNNLLEKMGLERVGNSARQLDQGLTRASDLLERGLFFGTPLFQAKDMKSRRKGFMVALITALAIGGVCGLIMSLLGAQKLSQTAAVAGGIVTMLNKAWPWVKGWAESRAHQKEELRNIIKRYENEYELKQTDIRKEINDANDQLSEARDQVQKAQREKDAADQSVAEWNAKIADATPVNLLADFIQDRVSSNDYRKHLGLPARIHNDFKTISALMEEENRKLSPTQSDGKNSKGDRDKYQDLEGELKEAEKRINRIILYIDDLDRCPPEKVVDVLQAIHLLLAFPLFVVVVGVDARWVTRSLETRYRRLLKSTSEQNQDMSNLIGSATSHDYLEKIFQIPFWLQPMNERACKDMVQGLLSSQIEKETSSQIESNSPLEILNSVSNQDIVSPPTDETQPEERNKPPNITPESKPIAPPDPIKDEHDLTETPREWRPQDPTGSEAKSLQITELELSFMAEDMAPLLGRSPRALKRFINVYRLIKAQYEDEFKLKTSADSPMSSYQAILFLLAIDTGTPDVAPAVFQLFLHPKFNSENKTQGKTLDWLKDQLKMNEGPQDRDVNNPDESPTTSQPSILKETDWDRLKGWLNSRKASQIMGSGISPLFIWAGRVVRYSFHSSLEQR